MHDFYVMSCRSTIFVVLNILENYFHSFSEFQKTAAAKIKTASAEKSTEGFSISKAEKWLLWEFLCCKLPGYL